MLRAPVKADSPRSRLRLSGTIHTHKCLNLHAQAEKKTAFDPQIEGRLLSVFSLSLNLGLVCYPPSVSRASLRLLRMQVKIGVSRNV